jgi:GNAT superfamily N-acetyltransferase
MPPASLRLAEPGDADAITRLVNLAFLVEQPFIKGNRIAAADVRRFLTKGAFLLVQEDGGLVGCVYVEMQGKRGYLGLLAVDPARQKTGFGSRLVSAAEEHCRAAGCSAMHLTVVNRRTELLAFYLRLGYVQGATVPFPEPGKMLLPIHLIEMSKRLANSTGC